MFVFFFSCVTCGGVQASSSSDSFCEITAKTLKIQLICQFIHFTLEMGESIGIGIAKSRLKFLVSVSVSIGIG